MMRYYVRLLRAYSSDVNTQQHTHTYTHIGRDDGFGTLMFHCAHNRSGSAVHVGPADIEMHKQ